MRNSPAAEEAKARAARPSHNIWLGVSVENQATADERIPLLLQTPAAVRFLSCEPLLGAINLTDMDWIHACDCGHIKAAHSGPDETGACWCPTSWANGNAFKPTSHCSCTEYRKKLHWVIVGGESGRGARPMHPDWARSLRDQCSAAGVPYFFKQWGAWAEVEWDGDITIDADGVLASEVYDPKYDCLLSVDGRSFTWKDLPDNIPARLMQRMRKKYTGRLLDGRLHDEFPREKA
jgi:protein gp37